MQEAENVDGDDGVLPLRSKREVAHGGEDREDGGDDDLGQVPDGNSKSAKKPKKGGKDQSQFQQVGLRAVSGLCMFVLTMCWFFAFARINLRYWHCSGGGVEGTAA